MKIKFLQFHIDFTAWLSFLFYPSCMQRHSPCNPFKTFPDVHVYVFIPEKMAKLLLSLTGKHNDRNSCSSATPTNFPRLIGLTYISQLYTD